MVDKPRCRPWCEVLNKAFVVSTSREVIWEAKIGLY